MIIIIMLVFVDSLERQYCILTSTECGNKSCISAERLRANNGRHVARRDAISTQRCHRQASDRTNQATSPAVVGLRRSAASCLLGRKIFDDQFRWRRRLLFAGI